MDKVPVLEIYTDTENRDSPSGDPNSCSYCTILARTYVIIGSVVVLIHFLPTKYFQHGNKPLIYVTVCILSLCMLAISNVLTKMHLKSIQLTSPLREKTEI